LSTGGGLRSAGRRRHPCRLCPAPRRSSGALSGAAAGSADQPARLVVEGSGEADRACRAGPRPSGRLLSLRDLGTQYGRGGGGGGGLARKRPAARGEGRAMRYIERHTRWQRAIHGATALLMVLMVLSGVAMFHPALFFLSELFGGGTWNRMLHP